MIYYLRLDPLFKNKYKSIPISTGSFFSLYAENGNLIFANSLMVKYLFTKTNVSRLKHNALDLPYNFYERSEVVNTLIDNNSLQECYITFNAKNYPIKRVDDYSIYLKLISIIDTDNNVMKGTNNDRLIIYTRGSVLNSDSYTNQEDKSLFSISDEKLLNYKLLLTSGEYHADSIQIKYNMIPRKQILPLFTLLN